MVLLNYHQLVNKSKFNYWNSSTFNASVLTINWEPKTVISPVTVTLLAKLTLPVVSASVIASLPSDALTAPACMVGTVKVFEFALYLIWGSTNTVCPSPVVVKSPADAFTNDTYLSFVSATELTSTEFDLCAVEIEPEIVPLICPVTIRSEATLTESDPVAALIYKSPELVLIVLASTVAIPILPATIPFLVHV